MSSIPYVPRDHCDNYNRPTPDKNSTMKMMIKLMSRSKNDSDESMMIMMIMMGISIANIELKTNLYYR